MSFDLDRVPAALRKKFPGTTEHFAIFLAGQLAGASDVSKAATFFDQAIRHQAKLPGPTEKSDSIKGFPATLIGYKEVTRNRASGGVLGTKLQLVFAEKVEKDGKQVNETIETGWLTYNAYIDPETEFEMAIANAVADDAVDLLGDLDEVSVFVVKLNGKSDDGAKGTKTAIHVERGYAKRHDS